MRRAVIGLLALAAVLPASAGAKTIHFRGETVRVPAGWPVIRLAEHPRACVRLDRRVVYLGAPSPDQRCPAEAMGRRRAILVAPSRASATASAAPPARISASSDFTGLGFDACAAPSRRAMRAWDSSPYRAVGVYIGGLNRACSQPNLTASWVAEQVAGGWSLIPTYVGLQAPTSSCTSCARLSAGSASFQGTAEASDAVEAAQAIGIGAGNPIYFDMEGYARTASATNATLTFLAAWTERLHALGYESGVYSSAASGIADLVGRLGSGYVQPDHIWIANWDGRRTAADPYVPDYAWSEHQRIRQYRGGHDESWGGVTINIDNNYVEGGTVGAAGPSDNPKGKLDLAEAPLPGQVRVSGWAFDPNAPGTPVSIRVYVGDRGAVRQELGPVAVQHRPDIAARFRASGGFGGFDVTFPTSRTGSERVCAYAVDIGPGTDRRLGCRRVGVRLPLALLGVEAGRRAIRVDARCDWPAGTQCPVRLALRARIRVGVGSGPRRRTRSVRLTLARRSFRLDGGSAGSYRVPLNRRGRELAAAPGRSKAKLLVAIPDGRIGRAVALP